MPENQNQTTTTLLDKVKSRLLFSNTDTYHDEQLTYYIEDIKNYMLSAGVSEELLNDEISVGCIARGVQDLYFSEFPSNFFIQRLIQLTNKLEVINNETR